MKKYMWLYMSQTEHKPIILYDYQSTRSSSCPKNFLKDYKGYEVVVLGCTHFIFYKDYLNEFLPETAHLVDGNMGTCKHVKEILEQKRELNEENHVGKIEIYNSSEDQKYMTLSNKLLAR